VARSEPEHEAAATDLVERLDVLAMMPGLRCSADRTQLPILIRDVTAAAAAATETPSQKPRSGLSGLRHRSSSGIQSVSMSICSA